MRTGQQLLLTRYVKNLIYLAIEPASFFGCRFYLNGNPGVSKVAKWTYYQSAFIKFNLMKVLQLVDKSSTLFIELWIIYSYSFWWWLCINQCLESERQIRKHNGQEKQILLRSCEQLSISFVFDIFKSSLCVFYFYPHLTFILKYPFSTSF
jgi:hypothetical protein